MRHREDVGWAGGCPCDGPTSVRSEAVWEVVSGKQCPSSSVAPSHVSRRNEAQQVHPMQGASSKPLVWSLSSIDPCKQQGQS